MQWDRAHTRTQSHECSQVRMPTTAHCLKMSQNTSCPSLRFPSVVLFGFLCLGDRRAGASPSRSPPHLSPALKMYCSGELGTCWPGRQVSDLVRIDANLWPSRQYYRSCLLSGGLLWRLDLRSSGCGDLHHFRGNPDEEAPLHWSGPCHLDRLQRSRVVMSAPPSALPARLISGSCDVQ